MNKVRRIKNDNYTTISNVFLRNDRLSLKAKGLLATILSLPDTWDFSIKGICAIVKEGTTAVYSAIDELKACGYCVVETLRDDKGRVTGNDYTFYENPDVENLNVDNQTQINKDLNNISIPNTNNNHIKELNKESTKEKMELFDSCWKAYGRKGSKKNALEQWNKLSAEDYDTIAKHIPFYVKSNEFVYLKDFERYLRHRMFESKVVDKQGNVLYDPEREDSKQGYNPVCGGAFSWNDYYNCYMYIGFWDGHIPDGYTDETRPDGASVVLNNGRGTVVWRKELKLWVKQ